MAKASNTQIKEERDISDEHADVLRTMCGVQQFEAPLPALVIELYWALKRVMDRVNCALSTADLAWVVVQAGRAKPTIDELRGMNVPTMFRGKEILIGDPIDAMYRNKLRRGKFNGVTGGGQVQVIFADNPEVRVIDPEKCFPPSDETLREEHENDLAAALNS